MAPVLVTGLGEPSDGSWVAARSAAEVERHALAGRTVVVTLTGDEDAQLAAAAVLAYLGARVFRTAFPEQVRRAVDMAESLAGRRPPALTRRGLA
ncbi:hypothetical protein Sme01_13010 [Sphaerisporangium melleum]|uniref:Uncharacterized protein n=1 Tax=Sphaerisporangium melleum TaxID=321316 RepID=A0A917RHM4_9ACTN|nr:hypothetical protein [Sphaerisporangium melleum]GGL08423.1 hypothetical protein GCM10007964_58420 [Sphaerisporangium melleum]GII68825.1 hypothetical protein Sme01_13010 [Sphaerisporangium melleum]